MTVTALDGRAYSKFLTAGAAFLRAYRQVLNDLNVFPVPDGDTGTNMYLTVRQAALEARREQAKGLNEVAQAAAQGSLMGARGNSGVIISQMLRGFAHHVRHRTEIDTFMLATGMREAVAAARHALVKPVEGTILSVAQAAADAAYHQALHERDFYRLNSAVLKAANDALERTPEQLPALKEAGVVDSGGAGFVYFLEGILRFLPDARVRATAFPRRPPKGRVFTSAQRVGPHKFCTEFVLEQARCSAIDLRELLEPRGESLIVVGAPPTLKVHVHTDDPEGVQSLAARHGTLTRMKVDNMEKQHSLLVVDTPRPSYSVVAAVPGAGFERIVRELGVEVTVSSEHNPSVADLLLAINKALGERVVLLTNDSNVALAAQEAAALASRPVDVVATPNVVAGIAALFALRARPDAADLDAAREAAARARTAQLFHAGKDATVGGTTVARGGPAALHAGTLYDGSTLGEAAGRALEAMGAASGGLVTLYYGGGQRERDAERLSDELRARFTQAEVDYYYGGQRNAEYWISLDE